MTILCGLFLSFILFGCDGDGGSGSSETVGNDFTAGNSLGMEFVLIDPGAFSMGSPTDESGHVYDEIEHPVTLTKEFYLQTTEVTQRQWETVMGENPSFFANCGADCPVENVSWNEVQGFIAALNAMGEGTYRLPTEAEWEYAARAGSTTALANGEIAELYCGLDPNLDAMGWYCGNADDTTHPVAMKAPNAWELYDMHGNVWEWCQDWYGDYPTDAVTDPEGPPSGSYRVSRGGSWNFIAHGCRSAFRSGDTPDSRSYDCGFRLVLVSGQQ